MGCIEKINQLSIPKRQINITRVGVDIGKKQVDYRTLRSSTQSVAGFKMRMDCVNFIKDETKLTRATVIKILKGVNTPSFLNNPERFIFEAIQVINEALVKNYVEQISYALLDDKFCVSQFEKIVSHKDSVQDITNKKKSIYDAVVFNSGVEKNFAIELDKDERIKLFIKLPTWFSVRTPLGGYTPDWAIVTAKIGIKDKESDEKVYFVIETKGSIDESQRRVSENQKIECAKKHFEVIKIRYKDVANYPQFVELMTRNWDDLKMPGMKSDLFFSDIISDEDIKSNQKFTDYLPVLSLEAVATTFGKEQPVEVLGWKKNKTSKKFNKDMFIAKVVGRSMEPTISR